jgi:HEAT repeat protein
MRTFLLGCVSLFIPLYLSAQTPVPALLTTVADTSATASARRAAALELGAAPFADQAEQQSAVNALAAALRSREVGLRINAATALGRMGDANGVAALSRGLGDTQPSVRRAAARSLGVIGTEEAARALLAIVDDGDLGVRAQVVHALGQTGEPVAVGALRKIFLSHDPAKDGRLSGEAVRSLLKMGGFAMEVFEYGLGTNDTSKQVASARALGELGDPRASKALIRVLASNDPRVGAAAESALASLGEPVMPDLIEALDAESPTRRTHALAAITDMGSPAVPTLVDLYTTSMAEVNDLETELQAAEDSIARAKAAAKASLAAFQDPPPPPDPSTMTNSEIQREVKGLKKQLKTQHGESKDIQTLVTYRRAANTFNEWIDSGRRELNGTPAPGPVATQEVVGVAPLVSPPTEVLINPKSQRVVRPEDTITGLEEQIDTHRRRAHDAVVALGQIGDDVSVTTLSDVVQNGGIMEATLAADALGRTGNANAIPVLIAAIGNAAAPSSARANAARGLGLLGATQALAALQTLADTDPAPNVRRAAQQAINMLALAVSALPTGSAQ